VFYHSKFFRDGLFFPSFKFPVNHDFCYECAISDKKLSGCTSTGKYLMLLVFPSSATETQCNMDYLLRLRIGWPFAFCEVLLSLQALVSCVLRGGVPDVTRYTTSHALLPLRDRARVASSNCLHGHVFTRHSTASYLLGDKGLAAPRHNFQVVYHHCSSLVYRQKQIRFHSDARGFMFQRVLRVVIGAQQLSS
jgi:hypothetical protein